jgi:hypothetical protein
MSARWAIGGGRWQGWLGLCVALSCATVRAETDRGGVEGAWGVWTGWFWPFNSTESPNLYGADEALARYDAVTGSNSQSWEFDHHGPALNQPDWAGHCHAWCGASVWEMMPTTNIVCDGVTFRPRDQAALLTEAYYNDTVAMEISLYRPTPGLAWRYLRQELKGENSMHGHAMALIGNLTTVPGQVWNYPIYYYQVDYAVDPDTGGCSGYLRLWFADDGDPAFADGLGLTGLMMFYSFSNVRLDADGLPLDSGSWAGRNPSQYPTSIWRPYPAEWGNYVVNPGLSGAQLRRILSGAAAAPEVSGAPTLSLTSLGGRVVLSWSTNGSDFQLESAASAGSAEGWETVSPAPVVVGDSYCVTNAVEGDRRFYRLRRP